MKKLKKINEFIRKGLEFYEKYFLIIVFFALLVFPSLFFYLSGDNLKQKNTENRNLATKPDLKLDTIEEFPKLFDEYYNDHIPYRSELRKNWVSLNYKLFNESVSNNVIIGKNDGKIESTWLFYNNPKDGEAVEEARGIRTFTDKEKRIALSQIEKNTNILKEKGIDLYYVIVPNKENIYKDKLPDYVKIYNDESRTDKLMNYLIYDKNVKNLIYLKKDLQEGRKKYDTYYKGDTHWNYFGAYLGANRIIKELNEEYEVDENVEIRKYEKEIGDLIVFANFNGVIKDYDYDISFLSEKKYTINDRDENGATITKCENALYDKNVLFICDSFKTAMIPYISKVYKNVTYIHIDNYKKEYIDIYKPDVVVVERVERYTRHIMTLNVY